MGQAMIILIIYIKIKKAAHWQLLLIAFFVVFGIARSFNVKLFVESADQYCFTLKQSAIFELKPNRFFGMITGYLFYFGTVI